MGERISLLAGTNLNLDSDLSSHIDSIVNEWVINWLVISTTQVTAWRAYVKVKRDASPDKYFYVLYETEDIVTIAPTNNQYIYIEVDQAKINDWSLNNANWTWIWSIKCWASVPTDNCIILAQMNSSWVIITTSRQEISLKWITRKNRWTWKLFYTDWNWIEQELTLDIVWKVLQSNWISAAPSFVVPTVSINWLTEKTSVVADDEFVIYDSVWLDNKKLKYWTIAFWIQQLILWENIISNWPVSLMWDWKIYKLNNNKRQLSSFPWTVNDRFAYLPNNKIARVTISSATLTIYIWTIDLTTNAITRWSWVEVTTNYSSWLTVCSMGTDKAYIWYSNTGDKTTYWRWVSIVWNVPSIWWQVSIASWFYSAAQESSCYVADWKAAIAVYISNNGSITIYSQVLSISWNTITWWWTAWWATLTDDSHNYEVNYVSDNTYLYTYFNNTSDNAIINLLSVSWTTPSLWTSSALWNHWMVKSVSDWTNIYTLYWNTNIKKYSYSWNTLTNIYTATVDSATQICKSWWMIWIIVWTTIVWYSDSTTLTKRNTIDYSVWLWNIFEAPYWLWYILTASPWATTYINKVWNEERNTIWYINTTWILWDNKFIYINSWIITWLTNIIPWETYYITNTWIFALNWIVKFGKWLTTTKMQIDIDIL